MLDTSSGRPDPVRRRTLLKLASGLAVTAHSTSGVVASEQSLRKEPPGNGAESNGDEKNRDEYPRVDSDEIPDEPISKYSTHIAFHPNQRRATVTTARFGHGFQMYVLQRVDGEDSVADAAWQITDSDGIVGAMEWEKDNRIRYDDDFTRYERKLPPSHKVFERTVLKEISFEGVNSL